MQALSLKLTAACETIGTGISLLFVKSMMLRESSLPSIAQLSDLFIVHCTSESKRGGEGEKGAVDGSLQALSSVPWLPLCSGKKCF